MRETTNTSMKVTSISTSLRSNKGFSLLEMVIVMGIIALILGGAIFAMSGVSDVAKLKRAQADLTSISTALMSYKTMADTYPSDSQGLQALVEKPTSAPIPSNYVPIMEDGVPLDPWDNDYIYKRKGSIKPNKPEVISMGPDGELNTDDDLSSQDRNKRAK